MKAAFFHDTRDPHFGKLSRHNGLERVADVAQLAAEIALRWKVSQKLARSMADVAWAGAEVQFTQKTDGVFQIMEVSVRDEDWQAKSAPAIPALINPHYDDTIERMLAAREVHL